MIKNLNKEPDYFESHINGDPTLRFLLRETTLDYNKLSHQVDVRIAVFSVALSQYLDKKYPTQNETRLRQ